MKRIGFDIDGILANFCPAYQRLFVQLTGRDTFLPGDDANPPSWNWPSDRGYTKEETSRVWESIKGSPNFWRNLEATRWLTELYQVRHALLDHEVYFITNRMGVRPKAQTENWLRAYLGIQPTVIIAEHRTKGLICRALALDAYIDDNYDNAMDCALEAPKTRTYLLDRNYNRVKEFTFNTVTDLTVEQLAERTEEVHKATRILETRRIPDLATFLNAEVPSKYTVPVTM